MAWASKTRRKLNRISKAEKIVDAILKDLGIFAHRNWGFQTKGGGYRFVDFMLRKRRLIIEIDGPEHTKEKDQEREREILQVFKKFSFIRFTNDEVVNSPDLVKTMIKVIVH